ASHTASSWTSAVTRQGLRSKSAQDAYSEISSTHASRLSSSYRYRSHGSEASGRMSSGQPSLSASQSCCSRASLRASSNCWHASASLMPSPPASGWTAPGFDATKGSVSSAASHPQSPHTPPDSTRHQRKCLDIDQLLTEIVAASRVFPTGRRGPELEGMQTRCSHGSKASS